MCIFSNSSTKATRPAGGAPPPGAPKTVVLKLPAASGFEMRVLYKLTGMIETEIGFLEHHALRNAAKKADEVQLRTPRLYFADCE